MRISMVALWGTLAAMATSTATYAITPPGGLVSERLVRHTVGERLAGAATARAPAVAIACGATVCDRVCCGDQCVENVSACTLASTEKRGGAHPMTCDGPEDCGSGQVCCVSGPSDASGIAECTSRDQCARGERQSLACHTARDCEPGQVCGAQAGHFSPSLLTCRVAGTPAVAAPPIAAAAGRRRAVASRAPSSARQGPFSATAPNRQPPPPTPAFRAPTQQELQPLLTSLQRGAQQRGVPAGF